MYLCLAVYINLDGYFEVFLLGGGGGVTCENYADSAVGEVSCEYECGH